MNQNLYCTRNVKTLSFTSPCMGTTPTKAVVIPSLFVLHHFIIENKLHIFIQWWMNPRPSVLNLRYEPVNPVARWCSSEAHRGGDVRIGS